MLDRVREYLIQQGNADPHVGLIHRLDRPVGGIQLFGRTPTATAQLSALFQERQVQKIYWALVDGAIEPEWVRLHHRIVPRSGNRSLVVPLKANRGKEAALSYRGLVQGRTLSLVEIRPETGRKHQLRAQLAKIGHPIVGDRKYLSRKKYLGEGIALFAKRLVFTHPVTEKELVLETPDFPFSDYTDLAPTTYQPNAPTAHPPIESVNA